MMSDNQNAPGPGEPGPATPGNSPRPRTRLRGIVLAVVGLVTVAALVALGITLGNRGAEPAAAATSSTSVTPGPKTNPGTGSAAASGTPAQSTAAAGSRSSAQNVDQLPPARPPVALDKPVQIGDVTVSLSLIESIQGHAVGRGDVNGPAVRVTVRVHNGTDSDFSLDGVSVNLFYGSQKTPGSPLDDSSRSPFSGSLPAGDAAEGVYVFSVPKDAQDAIRVEVGYRPDAPIAVFTGAAR